MPDACILSAFSDVLLGHFTIEKTEREAATHRRQPEPNEKTTFFLKTTGRMV